MTPRVVAGATLLAVLASTAAASGGAAVGELRVLVIRATWGPTPGSDDPLRSELGRASAFFARSSYGKASVTFAVSGLVTIRRVAVRGDAAVVDVRFARR